MAATKAFAPAKINLTLHVTGRRADGYHLLDSLVAFADVGDRITVADASDLSLSVLGPMAAGVPTDASNLVMRAARLIGASRGAAITLDKHLPAAAGIGGGSSDAAATLRALSRLWNTPLPADTHHLGADVPVCLVPKAKRMCGIGERLLDIAPLPPLPAVLVNPRVDVPTPAVFGALASRANAPMPETPETWGSAGGVADWLSAQRNDLQAAASGVAPIIGTVLAALASARLARMSGSGATCFGLFDTREDALRCANAIRAAHPDWWVADTVLGDAPDDQEIRATT